MASTKHDFAPNLGLHNEHHCIADISACARKSVCQGPLIALMGCFNATMSLLAD